jgi:crotonobetaine/carnitine-CoA ligase
MMLSGSTTRWTFRRLVDEQAERSPDRRFVEFDGRTVTFGDLRDRVTRAANALLELGAGPGSTVAMLTLNCEEWVDVWLAAAEIGALSTPVNAAFRGDYLVHQLRDSDARLVLVDALLLPLLEAVIDELPDLRVILVRDPSGAGSTPAAPGTVTMLPASVLAEGDAGQVRGGTALDWDDPACLFYTSGTTGPSKGVILTQHSLVSSAATCAAAYRYDERDLLYGAVPLFHLSGSLGVVLPPLLTGASAALDSGFHVHDVWDRVRALRATVYVAVGPMVMMLWSLPAGPEDAQLPLRLVVAAPIPAELHRPIEERYQVTIATGYGMTEVFPLAIHDVTTTSVPGAAGRANPEFEVALVDEDDVQVPVGAVGEIVCRPRSPHTMFEGYRGRPDATLEQLGNLWFHTGDLGRFDADGNLFFADRKKDAIRRRGENISSFEVEQSVLKHRAVAECAAIAVPSPLGEDDVKICVVIASEERVEPSELLAHCERELPRFAVPRYIEVFEALPKNAVGRVQKSILREQPLGPATWDREAQDELVG